MVILASQSRYRKKQLRDFGISFRAVRPSVDEATLKKSWLQENGQPKKAQDFVRLVQFLATAKAKSIADIYAAKKPTKIPADIFIIGSDQMAVVDGKKIDKPGSHARAVRQLRSMRGREHFLITAVSVIRVSSDNGRSKIKTSGRVVVARIKMRNFTEAEMLATLKADKPYDCAGSYKLERSGLQLVESIRVSDSSAIIGLPLIATYKLLRAAGYEPLTKL